MSKENATKRNDLFAICILAAFFLLMVLLLYAYENYPIDDDWSYIWAVKNFFSTGQMKFTDWTAPSLVSQVWWGWIFSYLFGFSFATMRLSILVISFVGLAFFYRLVREVGHGYSASLCITLLLLVNPCSFPLTFTFFTDIPFLSLLIISAYFFFKGEKDDRDLPFLFGSIISSLALLIRQNGLLIPIAVCIYLAVKEMDKKKAIKRGLLTIALPLITFAIFIYWLNVIHGQTAESFKHAHEIKENFLKPQLLLFKILWRPFVILEFIGFSLIPLSFACVSKLRSVEKGTSPLFILFMSSGILFFLFFEHVGLFPSIYQWADGFKFAFISEYGIRGIFNILILFFKLIDFASVFSITILVYLLIKQWPMLKEKFSAPSPFFLLLTIGLFQLLFLFVTRKWYSRYFITVLPFFLIVLLEGQKKEQTEKKILLPLLFLFFLFSLVICQDFMAWNQTRWRAGKELLNEGIPAHTISAGFPWDCWHSYDYSKAHPLEVTTQKGEVPWWIEDLTPAVDPAYVISSSPHLISDSSNRNYFQTDQYQVYKAYDYFSLFYLMKKRVYVLKRGERRESRFAGEIYFDFLKNLPLMEVKKKEGEDIRAGAVTIREARKEALLQPLNTQVTFRIALPRKPCVLKMNLGGLADRGAQEENGILFKILIDDALIDNLEGIVGVMGTEHRNAFMKPRALFAKPRTFFIHYLKPSDQKWQETYLDFSHFSGKVIDLTFSVAAWPHPEEQSMVACWGEPIIMVEH